MQVTVDKLIYGGDGLAHLPADDRGPGKAVFLPFVLAGERVQAETVEDKPGFVRARAASILESSPQRVQPGCPYFLACGGCHYQHAAYEHQLEIKTAVLRDSLRRIAKVDPPERIVVHPSPPWEYRNRTRLRVQGGEDFAIGYFRFGSHTLLPIEKCPISSPLLNRALAAMWALGREGKIPTQILEVEFFANQDDTALLIEFFASTPPAIKDVSATLREHLPELAAVAVSLASGNAASSPRSVSSLTYRTATSAYRVSAGSFFQTTRFLADELVSIVTSGRTGALALDLYAGVGLFAAPLAAGFERVIAVESAPASSDDLRYNVPPNVKPVRAKTEQYLCGTAAPGCADLVIVDPPRGGLGRRVTSALSQLAPPRITYISCDPATLARDLAALFASGYRIEELHLVDLFPQTFHIETVTQLVR